MPKHGIERTAIERIYTDFDRNFRDPRLEYADCQPTVGFDEAEYLKGNQKLGFFEDIYLHGVRTPIWVAKLTLDQREITRAKTGIDYDLRTIRGHRRIYTVNLINVKFPGHIKFIDCDVYEGLSLEQELELMVDHSPTQREQPLTELGLFRAVINLHAAGLGQEKIANLLGQKRGWSMRRIWLHLMGQNTPIEQDYLAQFDPAREKGSFVSIPISKVDPLHAEWSRDVEMGKDPMSVGANFREMYESFRASGMTAKPETKSQSRKAIVERLSHIKGRPALEEAMRFASSDGGNLADAAKMYDSLASKASEAESLAAELQAVKADAAKLQDSLALKAGEAESLAAELRDVKDELVKVRAELDGVKAELQAIKAKSKK